MKVRISCFFLALAFLSPVAVFFQTQAQAQALQADEFKDQWGNTQALDGDTRWLIVSQSMDAGDMVKETFEKLELTSPADYGLLYLADVSGMPGPITKFFALPAMRDYAFPMALIREEDELAALNLPITNEEAVTVLALESLSIVDVLAFDDAATFEAFLNERVLAAL